MQTVPKMTIELSIIIPVFNDEKHIERCIRSVLEQDICANRYEVIVVNDGSYDGTQSIVKRIQGGKKNLTLINTENQKLGAARNTGLKYAIGKFILYVDSDDYLRSNVLGRLLDEVENNNLDILFADYYNQEDASEEITKNLSYEGNNSIIQSGIDFIKTNEIYWVAWLCVYRKNFLVENKIAYREGVLFEDVDASIKSVFFAKLIKYEPIFFYVHTFNRNSITNSKRSSRKLKDQIDAAICLHEFVKTTRIIDEVVYSVLIRHVVLKYIEPLKTCAFLSFQDILATCKAVKNSKIDSAIYFKVSKFYFLVYSVIKSSPSLAAIAIISMSQIIKILRLNKRNGKKPGVAP